MIGTWIWYLLKTLQFQLHTQDKTSASESAFSDLRNQDIDLSLEFHHFHLQVMIIAITLHLCPTTSKKPIITIVPGEVFSVDDLDSSSVMYKGINPLPHWTQHI